MSRQLFFRLSFLGCHSTRASRRMTALFRPCFTLRSSPATAGSSTRLAQSSVDRRKGSGILREARVESQSPEARRASSDAIQSRIHAALLEGGELTGLDNLDWYSLERWRNGGVDLRCLMLDINLDCDLARLVCGSDSSANHPRNFEQVGLVPILDGAGRDDRRTRRTQRRIRGCGRNDG